MHHFLLSSEWTLPNLLLMKVSENCYRFLRKDFLCLLLASVSVTKQKRILFQRDNETTHHSRKKNTLNFIGE